VRFQVLTAASMKMRPFWDTAPYSLVGADRRFRGAYCLRHQGDDVIVVLSRCNNTDLKACGLRWEECRTNFILIRLTD
jgi:hypothetical protein